MKRNRATEDYLKTIFVLSKKGDVHGAHIARELGLSRPTVSVTLRTLEKEGYLTMDSTKAVYLTEQGRLVAQEVYERHRTIRRLLEALGVEKETASTDACRMEHALSPESFEALKGILKIANREDRESEDGVSDPDLREMTG